MTFDKKAYRQRNAEAIKAYDREYRKRNAAARSEYNRVYLAAHREQHRAYMREWSKRHFAERKTYSRKSNLKRIYALTQEAYDALLLSQGGGCGICGSSSEARQFSVDHDHETGEVRGLLCHKCNLGLGLFGESFDRLLDAVAYLKKKR